MIKRLCCRPGCGHPAVATLTYSHSEMAVVVSPLSEESDPHSWDLCARHAERVNPPQGWSIIRHPLPAEDMTALLDTVQTNTGQAAQSNQNRASEEPAQLHARSRADRWGEDLPVNPAITAQLQDTISRLDFTGTHETDEAEAEEFEPDIVSPLLEAAKQREEDKKRRRGRGEEVVVKKETDTPRASNRPSNTNSGWVPGAHSSARPQSHNPDAGSRDTHESRRPGAGSRSAATGGQVAPQSSAGGKHRKRSASLGENPADGGEPRHPALRNLPGRRKFHLHAVPDPEEK